MQNIIIKIMSNKLWLTNRPRFVKHKTIINFTKKE